MNADPIARIVAMVEDDDRESIFKVQRNVFVDDDVLAMERRTIFDRSWLYAAHESEVPQRGAFVRRNVAGRDLLVVRDADDRVGVFFNACSHRGNLVCQERSGQANQFTCFYHAWSFGIDGSLLRVPLPDAYGASFDMKAHGLKAPAEVVNYRGLIFISFAPQAGSFESYLGNAKPYVDFMIDNAGDGQEIVAGSQRYSMRANWKLLVENSIDSYHAPVVHQRYFGQYMQMSPVELKRANDPSLHCGRQLDNGHAVVEAPALSMPIARHAETLQRERERLIERLGAATASRILDNTRMLFLFPNTIMISSWRTIRTFHPVSPGYMEIESWALMPKSDSVDIRKARLDNFISFLGPAGFGTPDDVEALEGCQRGIASNPDAWSDISRGMNREVPIKTDELQMRSFWREWRARIGSVAQPRVAELASSRGVR